MKINKTLVQSALLALVVSAFQSAHADDIQLGTPAYGGNGCPGGTASVTLSQDAKSLSIIFDQFVVEAGGANRTLERKTCNVAIPVHIPQGFSVSVVNVDYRGYVSLPAQASARMTAEYFLAGSVGPKFDKMFLGKTDTDYQFSNQLDINAQVWSACGADTILRVNAAMLVKTNRYNDQATATVDSADFKTGILYQLQWKRCSR
ncbi:MAG: DUF4360 domain-containing protein [Bacteriovorax sp.]|nr:DUF4360 domain-containing protein [Bacteriovorax sp.]